MKSSKPFDSNDIAFPEKSYRLVYRIFFFINFQLFTFNSQLNMWTTHGAGIRLGMESPVFRGMIFLFTIRTHLEYCHGRIRPVVRNGSCYRIAGAAVCTVDEGIEGSSVIFVEHVPASVGAYGNI